MPEKISARGLLDKLGLGRKKPEAVTPPAALAATETPAVPPATPTPEASQAAAGELPDWLSAPSTVEPTPAPTPESAPATGATSDWLKDGEVAAGELRSSAPVASLSVPEAPVDEVPVPPQPEISGPLAPVETVAEAPVVSPALEAEKSPEQLAIEQFEEALISADNALGRLRAGEGLDEMQLRAAKAATATANGLIRKLPERYLKVLLASRRVGENRDYTRMNFQEDMGAAIRIFSQAKKG